MGKLLLIFSDLDDHVNVYDSNSASECDHIKTSRFSCMEGISIPAFEVYGD